MHKWADVERCARTLLRADQTAVSVSSIGA